MPSNRVGGCRDKFSLRFWSVGVVCWKNSITRHNFKGKPPTSTRLGRRYVDIDTLGSTHDLGGGRVVTPHKGVVYIIYGHMFTAYSLGFSYLDYIGGRKYSFQLKHFLLHKAHMLSNLLGDIS